MPTDMPRLLLRILGAAAALIVCAWFVLGIRQSHDINAATAIISGTAPPSPAQARRARSLLDSAAQLNPDRSVDLLRSQLVLREGDPARARALALAVARSEPENIQAWLAYGSASAHDRAAFTRALRRLDELAPPVGGH